MARKPRIEYPGAFFHIIVRGNNRQEIFHGDEDRKNYLKRLATFLDEDKVTLYCFCLMTNHVHLLVEMGESPLSRVIQRLHTWYAHYYNQKYKRVGHLFQGRYKAMLCDKAAYLLELVRYIHLNPVRSGITSNPREYPWSSHRAYLGEETHPGLNTDLVLSQFATNVLHARELYERFVMGKLGEGRREDLYKLTDQRILGGDEFIAKVLDADNNKPTHLPSRRLYFDLPILQRVIETELNMEPNAMLELGRSAVLARRMFCYVARELGGFKSKEVAAYLGKDMATVTQGVRYIGQALRESHRIKDQIESVVSRMETGQATFQERIRILRDFFTSKGGLICLAYLFGSAASDGMGPLSDVDTAVLYDGEVDWDRHFEIAHKIQGLLGKERADLIALNTAPAELAYTCIDEGVLLYAKSPLARIEFETKVLNLYGDLLPMLRTQRLEILESGNERDTGRYYKALGETEGVLRKIRAPSGEEQRGF
jgi:putative transposase